MDGAKANDNNDESGAAGQTQGLQDTRYGLCILYIHISLRLIFEIS